MRARDRNPSPCTSTQSSRAPWRGRGNGCPLCVGDLALALDINDGLGFGQTGQTASGTGDRD